MKYRYLSHILTNDIPVYGGRSSLGIRKVRSIAGGDSSNVHVFSMQNHWGTHIDLPRHYFDNGNTVGDYPPQSLFFKNPQSINIILKPSEIMKIGQWVERISPKTDLVLFRSGWHRFRDKDIYSKENPGIDAEVGLYLRKNFPIVRAIGIDWISISPYSDRPSGRVSHKAFLDPEGEGEPILIIEDMDLAEGLAELKEVSAVPLRIEVLDSVPCTVVGCFND